MYILIDGATSEETIVKGEYTNPCKIFDYPHEVEEYLSKMYTRCKEEQYDMGGIADFLKDFVLYYVDGEEVMELEKLVKIERYDIKLKIMSNQTKENLKTLQRNIHSSKFRKNLEKVDEDEYRKLLRL